MTSFRAVQIEDHVERLQEHGVALAVAAETAGLDATVTTCPDWTVRELLGHVGQVHRWAASFVHDARTDPPQGDAELADVPADDELLDWFVAGHAALVGTLRKAPHDVECWSFLPAPSPLAFWARRQAHETAIHRVDAESALAATSSGALGTTSSGALGTTSSGALGTTSSGLLRTTPVFDTKFAVDGIDELLLGFFSRPRGRLIADPPVSLAVRASDADTDWTVHIGPSSREVTRGVARGDCFVEAPASDLYLLLWNRRTADGLKVAGDAKVLDLWRSKATVAWR